MATNSRFSIAVHVLTMLTETCEGRVKSDYIARSVNTNPVVIRRLLCSLQEANLVVSQVGATGGTCLARPAEKILLSDVYQAVSHGEIFSLHPKTPNQDCPVGKNIEAIMCRLQKEIDKTIEEKLAQYSLRDVIEMVGQKEKV
ncbi:MAG: Rrf2 family transcriptional regulator [Acidobacteriota bacterium]|nr:Rrf2 family transcriptional regulator [Acidobacteriota bacterium]